MARSSTNRRQDGPEELDFQLVCDGLDVFLDYVIENCEAFWLTYRARLGYCGATEVARRVRRGTRDIEYHASRITCMGYLLPRRPCCMESTEPNARTGAGLE